MSENKPRRVAADLLIVNARSLYTCAGPAPRIGKAQGEAGRIEGGALAALDGRIVFAGPSKLAAEVVEPVAGATVLDASGCTIVPGFVDPHTHVVYAGNRADELRRRLAGASYEEIAASGGGIVSTVRATREASEDTLVAESAARLWEMLAQGTTTVEVKSGYGLDTEAELKMLRVVRRLGEEGPWELVPTFMGAHEIPVEHRSDRRHYISLVIDEMIPAVSAAGLAEWCDVFCEKGVYTPGESREILRAGLEAGLRPRIHADELALSGGSQVAAEVGARSADHLLFADAKAADALAKAGVVATLLPAAAFYLKVGRFAPARMLIERGVAVALATDMNPGGGFSPSMPFAMTLACFAMQMTAEEALVAATINAAYALDRHRETGSLEPGKQADAVIVRGDLVDLLRAGAPSVETVVKKGRVVLSGSGRTSAPSASS